jgi:hypothetical protein
VILILTNEEDVTTDFVVRELAADEFIRVNVEQIPSSGSLFYKYVDGKFLGELTFEGRHVALDDVTAVYSRRAGVPNPAEQIADEGVRAYARAEFVALVEGLSRLVTAPWINHPFDIRRAESKPFQLNVARLCGLRVPRTLVTNNPDEARQFAVSCEMDVVLKSLAAPRLLIGGEEHVIFTTPLPRDANALHHVHLAPCIIQQHVRKRCDIRVTVVGDRVFAVEIDSQSVPEAATDWRVASANVPHRSHVLPTRIVAGCLALCRRLGLRFGALDFAIDQTGEYVFFEINPSGQWAWLELATGVPIARAIADLLRSSSCGGIGQS